MTESQSTQFPSAVVPVDLLPIATASVVESADTPNVQSLVYATEIVAPHVVKVAGVTSVPIDLKEKKVAFREGFTSYDIEHSMILKMQKMHKALQSKFNDLKSFYSEVGLQFTGALVAVPGLSATNEGKGSLTRMKKESYEQLCIQEGEGLTESEDAVLSEVFNKAKTPNDEIIRKNEMEKACKSVKKRPTSCPSSGLKRGKKAPVTSTFDQDPPDDGGRNETTHSVDLLCNEDMIDHALEQLQPPAVQEVASTLFAFAGSPQSKAKFAHQTSKGNKDNLQDWILGDVDTETYVIRSFFEAVEYKWNHTTTLAPTEYSPRVSWKSFSPRRVNGHTRAKPIKIANDVIMKKEYCRNLGLPSMKFIFDWALQQVRTGINARAGLVIKERGGEEFPGLAIRLLYELIVPFLVDARNTCIDEIEMQNTAMKALNKEMSDITSRLDELKMSYDTRNITKEKFDEERKNIMDGVLHKTLGCAQKTNVTDSMTAQSKLCVVNGISALEHELAKSLDL